MASEAKGGTGLRTGELAAIVLAALAGGLAVGNWLRPAPAPAPAAPAVAASPAAALLPPGLTADPPPGAPPPGDLLSDILKRLEEIEQRLGRLEQAKAGDRRKVEAPDAGPAARDAVREVEIPFDQRDEAREALRQMIEERIAQKRIAEYGRTRPEFEQALRLEIATLTAEEDVQWAAFHAAYRPLIRWAEQFGTAWEDRCRPDPDMRREFISLLVRHSASYCVARGRQDLEHERRHPGDPEAKELPGPPDPDPQYEAACEKIYRELLDPLRRALKEFLDRKVPPEVRDTFLISAPELRDG
ncbi:MAG: hypothetical protein L0216_18135 [Planctomycetales bacterium]|nr:hypothetical protein [Planctomycetales bacterium]